MKHLVVIVIAFSLAACGSAPPQAPVPEPIEDARELHELGTESFGAGRYREAIAAFSQAEHEFLSVDDAHGVAVAAISRAETELLLGERDAAERSLGRARTALERIRNARLRERAELLAARLAMHDDPARARERLAPLLHATTPAIAAQAALLACELEMQRGSSQCIGSLKPDDALTRARIAQLTARAAMRAGNQDVARAHLDEALNIYRALAWRPGIAAVHAEGATLAQSEGDARSARSHLERALYLRLWMHDRVHAAELVARLLPLAQDDVTRARYRRWHDTLRDTAGEPEWDAMLMALFNQR